MNKDNNQESKTTVIKQDNTLPIIAIGLSAVALITTLFTATFNPAFAHETNHEPSHSQQHQVNMQDEGKNHESRMNNRMQERGGMKEHGDRDQQQKSGHGNERYQNMNHSE